jgi:hypothetical protein
MLPLVTTPTNIPSAVPNSPENLFSISLIARLVLFPRDCARYKSHNHPHHPSGVQNIQQTGSPRARKSVEPSLGFLLGKAESYSSVSGRDVGFYIWYARRQCVKSFSAVTMIYSTVYIQISVIHSIAHFINAINFVKHFDPKLAEINWARDANDVSLTTLAENRSALCN